jgi:hypothetical protein
MTHSEIIPLNTSVRATGSKIIPAAGILILDPLASSSISFSQRPSPVSPPLLGCSPWYAYLLTLRHILCQIDPQCRAVHNSPPFFLTMSVGCGLNTHLASCRKKAGSIHQHCEGPLSCYQGDLKGLERDSSVITIHSVLPHLISGQPVFPC